ncbi:hypothetical protein [Roseovarius sp. M141]|uniref:hypothetical protein n=1 Tax=Roseovarius sp. M141 TaxID=2583806 RepID=UPI0020CC5025|nr:hypothetical protein [Roseovarius sp. M141]MCQ0092330.1 hypothetical protein [Roseovarius sp. M141]
MQIERTLTQLQVKPSSPQRARELGQLGYMQWLGGLPGHADYNAEAARAYLMAVDFIETDPTIAVFCELLCASMRQPLQPLDLALPKPARRGGARARRSCL